MKYELAKELKEAGFPQKSIGKTQSPGCPHFGTDEWVKEPNFCGCFVHHPTLSELIEACRTKPWSVEKPIFESLCVLHNDDLSPLWEAYTDIGDIRGHGTTPEEAVAKLWLALNKK